MTQHPKGAELVEDLLQHASDKEKFGSNPYWAWLYETNFNETRNAIIALIDDPVRAAGPELLAAGKQYRCVENGEPRTCWIDMGAGNHDDWKSYADKTAGVTIEYRTLYALGQPAAIAKAEAPADAEGGA